MGERLLILTVLLAVQAYYSSGEPVGSCPDINYVYATFLQDSDSCSVFYECDWGIPYRYDCPAGLDFNTALNVCDWPFQANCALPGSENGLIEDDNDGDTDDFDDNGDGTWVGECPEEDGEHVVHIPHVSDCNLFYKCEGGIPILYECPPDLHFNPVLEVCDFPEVAGCETGTGDNGDGSDGSPDGLEGDGSDGDGNGEGEEENEIEDVTDGNDGDNGEDSGGTWVGECPEEDGEHVVHLPHLSDCNLFYKCEGGIPILYECPPNLHFNPVLEVCDFPEDAGCQNGTGDNGDGTDGDPDDLEGDGSDEDGNGEGEEENEIEDVTDSNDGDNGEDSGGTWVGECPEEDGEHVVHLPHLSDCNLFYKCEGGIPILYECPPNLHFNPVLEVCDFPEDAGCQNGTGDNGDGTDGDPDDLEGDGSDEDGNGEGEEENEIEDVTDSNDGDNGEDSGGTWVGECPEEDGEHVVHLPHLSDCNLFYKCEGGIPILYECPPNLHFNPVLEVCDFPEDAGCQNGTGDNGDGTDGDPDDLEGDGSDEDGNGEGEEENEIEDVTDSNDGDNGEDSGGTWVGECPEEDGEHVVHLPHLSDCNLFYKCEGGIPILYECPPNLHFNPVLEVCDFPEDAGCQNGTGDNGDGTDGDPDDLEGDGSDEDGNGEGEEENEIEDVTDSNDGDNGEDSGGTWVGECPEEDGEHVVHLPHLSDCNLFYKCEGGIPILYECPPNLHFNPVLEVCDFPEDAGCQNGTGDNGDGTDEGPDDLEGDGSDEDGNGEGEEENEIEDVTDSNDGDNGEDSGGTWVGECPEEDGEHVVHLPHLSDCNLFYKCEGGIPILYECPPNLHFNPILEVCDFPEDAGCQNGTGDNGDGTDEGPDDLEGDGSDEDGNGEGEEENEIEDVTDSNDGDNGEDSGGTWVGECPEEDGEHVVHLPHLSDCNLFYKCEGGIPILYECPPNLHFNPILEVCDFPEDAGCQNGTGDNGDGTDEGPDDLEGDGSDEDGNGESEEENEIEDVTDGNDGDTWVGECPEEDGEYTVHFPHESDCNLFYVCNRGTPVLYECPLNLHFNPTLGVCDFPENAGCQSESDGNNEDEEDDNDGDNNGDNEDENWVGECPEEDGQYAVHFPHESDCNLFYVCNRGTPVLYECPMNLHFNPTLGVCDFPENAGCQSESDGNNEDEEDDNNGDDDGDDSDNNGDNGGENWVGECPEEDGEYAIHLPHESDCTLFYKCNGGTPVLQECPAGLYFNPIDSVCDFPENSGCQNGSNEGDDNDEEDDNDGDDDGDDSDNNGDNGGENWVGECPEEDGEYAVHLPHESDCTLFYKCNGGTPVLQECPAGLYFNPIDSVCDFPENSGCQNGSNEGDDNDEEDDNDGDDDGDDSDNNGDNGGENWVGECPEEDGEYAIHLPHESDCTLFYKCNGGTPVLQECPAGLYFNPIDSVCDFPENSGCQNGSNEGDDNDEEDDNDGDDDGDNNGDNGGENWVGECPEEDGEYAVHLPHESDCTLFYKCNGGTPVLQECPAGLHFNPIDSVCDFPENSGCQNGSNEGDDNDEEDDNDGDDDGDDSDNNEDNGGENWVGECPEEDGEYAVHLPHESDCTLFYKCNGGTPVLQECPAGLYFNPIDSVCDFPENAGCQSGSDGDDNDGDTDDLEGDGNENWVGECPEEDGEYITLLPDASNCTVFYKCDRGTPVAQECPSGLYFNPVLLVCDYPENAGCQNGPDGDNNNGGNGFCDTVSCPEINEQYVTFIPFDSDCTRFCKCDWGRAYEFVCPAGLYFNPILNVCDYPNDSGCTM